LIDELSWFWNPCFSSLQRPNAYGIGLPPNVSKQYFVFHTKKLRDLKFFKDGRETLILNRSNGGRKIKRNIRYIFKMA
jgi:hypothetical protein